MCFCHTPFASAHTHLSPESTPSQFSSSQIYLLSLPSLPIPHLAPAFWLIFVNKKILGTDLSSSYRPFKKLLLLSDTAFKKPLGNSVILVSFQKLTSVKKTLPLLSSALSSPVHAHRNTRETHYGMPALPRVLWREAEEQHATISVHSYSYNSRISSIAGHVHTLHYHFSAWNSSLENSFPVVCMQESRGLRTSLDKELERKNQA